MSNSEWFRNYRAKKKAHGECFQCKEPATRGVYCAAHHKKVRELEKLGDRTRISSRAKKSYQKHRETRIQKMKDYRIARILAEL